MSSSTEIVNAALIKLGADLISDISQLSNRNARIAAQVYDMIRQQLLRCHPWNFATVRASLAADSTAPIFQYAYRYLLPADCLRVIRMYDPYTEYTIEGRYILTDSAPSNSDDSTVAGGLNILYISDITDPGIFDAGFRDAFIVKLAATIGKSITGSLDGAMALEKEAEMKLRYAKQVNGQEDTAKLLISDVWISAGEF